MFQTGAEENGFFYFCMLYQCAAVCTRLDFFNVFYTKVPENAETFLLPKRSFPLFQQSKVKIEFKNVFISNRIVKSTATRFDSLSMHTKTVT